MSIMHLWMACAMRTGTILILVLLLACPALAAHERLAVGHFNVSFDMNTTQKYTISTESPSTGNLYGEVSFVRNNITINGEDGFIWIVLTEYSVGMDASISADRSIVASTLQAAGSDSPKIYQPAIDGHPGYLGSSRFPSGEVLVCASYSPDAVVQSGKTLGRVNCRVLSNVPWEVIRDMLNSLHVEFSRDEAKAAW